MVYVTKYNHDKEKDEIAEKLKNPPSLKKLDLEDIKKYTVGEFHFSKSLDGSIQGKLSVRREFVNKDFERTEDYDIKLEEEPGEMYDEVTFTIYPDMRIITFSSKDSATEFGRKTISKILFESSKELKIVHFSPEKILQAKKNGEFSNVWYNGVKTPGKVDYTSQYGTEIDEDKKFLDADERSGIGVEFRSKTGKDIKIAVYSTGSVVKMSRMDTIRDEIKVRKEMIDKVIDYSNFENPAEDPEIGFRDLTDF
ncbi:MAG: hypothetical protein ABEJ83_02725 [Candidatus Nanohaloarchaea archaeon]